MAVSRRKGKLIVVLTVSLLVADLFYFPSFCCVVLASESDPSVNSNSIIENDSKHDTPLREDDNPFKQTNVHHELVRKQQLQLDRLQELVQNLTQLVARLESPVDQANPKVSSLSVDDDKMNGFAKIKDEDVFPGKGEVGRGRGGGPMLVTKYNTFWSERFQFVSAVKMRSKPSCLNMLPNKDFQGLSKYFAVGDDKGKLYLFLRSGDVALELEEPSPITAIVSYLGVYKNETMIVTGHHNGMIAMHRVWETFTGDEWSSLHVKRVTRFETAGLQINMLEVHHVGRRRYLLATDDGGKITVLREDGTVYGAATPSRPPIAFLKQRLLFLTDSGAGSLDLKTMKLKETECEGLNSSLAKIYVFDAMDRSRAYGLTQEGELVQTLLLGDVMNFKCRVRTKRKLDMDQPQALEAIKGYLLIANTDKVSVYNVSSQHYLRLLFSASLDQVMNRQNGKVTPLITSDHEKLVIISFGDGYVAMYRSSLPLFKNEFNSFLWTSPVLFFILFLFGACQFFANKKEALTSDEPFTLASGKGDTDSGGLRGSWRYIRDGYRPGVGTEPRPGPNHYIRTDSRSESSSRYRATAELKYRG